MSNTYLCREDIKVVTTWHEIVNSVQNGAWVFWEEYLIIGYANGRLLARDKHNYNCQIDKEWKVYYVDNIPSWKK